MKFRQTYLLTAAGLLLVLQLLTGCDKLKDDRNSITDPFLKITLLELISADPQLSTFREYLGKTGYDIVISSSKNYTVFAPVNSALASLDPAIVNDAAKLKLFVGNHIALKQYRTADIKSETRIEMLNGKFNNMLNTSVEDAAITTANKYASNGLLHVINKSLPALANCWEFINSSAEAPAKQKAFILSLFRKVFDTSNAVITGINPLTGDPIYQPGTDSVFANLFLNRVHDVQKEEKQFTVFMLTDAAWDMENTKFRPYYVTNTADSNALVTGWHVVKDFAVDTLYKPGSLPDTIVSKFGTKLPIEKAFIVKTVKTSNGMVYIMSKMNVLPASKLKTITIQTEFYSATSHDRRSNTFFRDRYSPVTLLDFKDILVYSHGVSLFNIRYDVKEVPSIKYKAYWVAVNDFQTATFQQKLGIGTATSTILGYVNVDANNFNEVYLGEFTMSTYSPVLNIYLTGANSTTAAVNPLVCDYIKLVPSL
ncbi:MAG: fasciclin domain-containing protein [Chitinophagaceae bacterium]|nr:fasciclin domain-containing protein [Chitinophagaceae bacterium]